MSKKHILIITDEFESGRELVRQLDSLGYEASAESSHGGDPVQLAAQLRPDLVVLDLPTDPSAGIATAVILREQHCIPVVLLSGATDERRAEQLKVAKACGVVGKPWAELELRVVLACALRVHEAECRLQQSEERIQHMLRTSRDCFWVLDSSGRVREANEDAAQLTGYSREELLQLNIQAFVADRTPDQFAAGFAALLRAGFGVMERPMRRKDGTILTVETSITCPPAEERLLYCFSRDITARVKTEARLRNLTCAIEQSPAAILITDKAGRIEYVNPCFETMTGYAAAEVIGQNPRILKSGAQSPEFYQELWRVLATGQTWSGEFQNRRKDGTQFWEQASISPMRNAEGRVTHYIGVKEDITAKREARLTIARRESCLTAIIENHRGFVWLKDCAGRFLAVNRNLAHALGLAGPAALVGKTDFDFFPEKLATVFRTDDLRVIAGRDSALYEEPGQFGGREIWLETYKTPVVDEAGQIIGIAGSAIDITARRQAREELIRAKEEAEAASRAKSNFLAAMSHELRTPLNVINGISATFLEQKQTPPQRQALELILQSGQGLLTIIEEILDYSSLQAGKTRLDETPFDLAALIQQVVGQAAELPAAKHLTLTATFDPALPVQIKGDARRLRQVLLNLLSNAVKFTASGGVHLVIRPQLGAPARPGLHCSVVDTGIGIDEAHREMIFQPFAQADGSIRRRFGGTGLGLAISRSFLQLMGGDLRLRSRVGVGSVFHFTVPYDPVSAPPVIVARPEGASLRGQKLLIAVTVGKRRRQLAALARNWGMDATLVDPAKASVFALINAAPSGLALVEADTVSAGSPLRTWLDYRRDSRPLPLLWLHRPGQSLPEGAGAPVRSITSVLDPVHLARELANLLDHNGDSNPPKAVGAPCAGALPLGQSIPLTVLAADDVLTNRHVLGLILRHLGYGFTMVENGAEVLDALSVKRYDLVLLDIQMPVMDGLTAAREICRLYPNAQFRPKIVAITANALQGDREKCLDAGMDEFLTKPVIPATLAACIQKLFAAKALTAAPFVARPPADSAAGSHWIDEAHLQTITQGLAEDQVAAALDGMHTSAGADFSAVFPQVEGACADHDPEALRMAIHGLKGCFQMLGWSLAAAGCVQALAEVRSGGFTRWETFPRELLGLYQNSRQAMTRYLDSRTSLAHRTL